MIDTTEAKSSDSILAGIPVVDVDTHLTEPHDLWTSRAPANWRDRVPQVKMINGSRTWVIDGDTVIGRAGPASSIKRNGEKSDGVGFLDYEIEDVHVGSYSLKERLAMMDETGIYAQVIYPNVLGFGGQRASTVDADVRLISTQLYNDFSAEMQEASGGRLYPMALLPWWDMKETLKEIDRCHKMGLRGVNTNSDPHNNGLPDLGTEHWYPMWEMVSDLGLPVNFHIGASDESMTWFGNGPWASESLEKRLVVGSSLMSLTNVKVMANFIVSGVLERFPKLNLVSVESGIGWIPFLFDTLDYCFGQIGPTARANLTMTPEEYFRRQIYGCFWYESKGLEHLFERVGADNIMFETDFPHPACLYPNPLDAMAKNLAGIPYETRRKVMGGNAARVYNIPLETVVGA